jgi:hypothetical protein
LLPLPLLLLGSSCCMRVACCTLLRAQHTELLAALPSLAGAATAELTDADAFGPFN